MPDIFEWFIFFLRDSFPAMQDGKLSLIFFHNIDYNNIIHQSFKKYILYK